MFKTQATLLVRTLGSFLKITSFLTIFEDLDRWQSPNQLKPGFHEIKHRFVNFSSLGLVPRLQDVNDKIKNIPSRKCFKEH